MRTRIRSIFGSFYSRWYPRQYARAKAGDLSKLHRQLRPHVQYSAKTSKKLARGLFHSMMRFGPKLDRAQLLLSRYVGVATELFAMNATCSYAQHMMDSGKPADEILSLANYFCTSAKSRIDQHFAGTSKNADARGYALVQDLLKGEHEELRTGIV